MLKFSRPYVSLCLTKAVFQNVCEILFCLAPGNTKPPALRVRARRRYGRCRRASTKAKAENRSDEAKEFINQFLCMPGLLNPVAIVIILFGCGPRGGQVRKFHSPLSPESLMDGRTLVVGVSVDGTKHVHVCACAG